jgi:hypothetical protein
MGKSISKIKWILLLFLLFPTVSYSNEFKHYSEWDSEKKVEFIVYTGLVYTDYKMTKWALDQKDSRGNYIYYEENPLLGKRPSDEKILVFQLLSVASYYYLTGLEYKDPKAQRILDKFRYFAMGARVSVILYNDSLGISFSKAL